MAFLQSIPIASRREMLFRLATAAGGVLTGQTFSGAEIQIRKAGGVYANANSTQQTAVVELGATGVYVYQATTGELDTPGSLMLRVLKGAALVFEEEFEVLAAIFATAITGTLTPSSFTTSLASTVDDFHKDSLAVFWTGALAAPGSTPGQVKKVGAYNGTSKLITLATINSVQQAFTAAPANGDVLQIINR